MPSLTKLSEKLENAELSDESLQNRIENPKLELFGFLLAVFLSSLGER